MFVMVAHDKLGYHLVKKPCNVILFVNILFVPCSGNIIVYVNVNRGLDVVEFEIYNITLSAGLFG